MMPDKEIIVNKLNELIFKFEESANVANYAIIFGNRVVMGPNATSFTKKYVSDIAPDCKDVIAEKFEGRYFFTPKKMGAQTAEANINAGIAGANQIVNYLEKGDETFKVNQF